MTATASLLQPEPREDLTAWKERAICAQTDPDAFFPEMGGSTRNAKKVCLSCDVRGECLQYALANDERFGVWGGLSERERRNLKKDPDLMSPGERESLPAREVAHTTVPAAEEDRC